jgi:type I restriction enzyme S subunit
MQQSDWQIASFGDCADFQEGYVNPAQSVATYFDGPISWLRAVDLNDGFVTATSRTLSEEGFRSAGKSATMFPAGSLAISKSGTIGRIGILQHEMCGNRAVINVKPRSDRLDLRFAFYAMLLGRPEIERFAEGSVQKNLYVSALSKFKFLLPPLPEQRTIASVLGALDDKIELNRRMNETLEATARAIFRDWFVDFGPTRAKIEGRPPYLSPDIWSLFPNRLDDEGKPEGWSVGSLSDIAILNPESWSRANYPDRVDYVDLSNTKWGAIETIAQFKSDAAPSRAQRILRPGDTVVGTVRPANGSYAFVSADGLTGSTGFAVLRPIQDIYREAVYLAATSKDNIDRLAHLADGGAYPAVRPELVAATEFVSASEGVLAAFSSATGGLIDRAEANKRENRTLAATRDFLLPKLMSGEVRVKDAEKLVGEAT